MIYLISERMMNMLCQFSFSNFKSYKNESTLDFQASSSVKEFDESLIRGGSSNPLLPVAVVYGPNGGGKSNLLAALSCLITTIVKPIYDIRGNSRFIMIQDRVENEPFLFDDNTKAEPTEFLIYFSRGQYEYRYYLALLNGDVYSESLDRKKLSAKRPAHIFSREKQQIELGASLQGKGINTNVNSKMPFFSFLAITYDIPAVREAQEWFESCVIRSYGNPIAEMQIMVAKDGSFKNKIITALNDMDIDVADFRFDDDLREIFVGHSVNEHMYEMPLSSESDGTRKLIAALPVILIALSEGRLVIIDELDAKLHPKLLRYIISLFTNPKINKHGAQLLFTSHDMSTMKNTVFRRDEIWFAALDEDRSSTLYSLYDIRREDNEHVNSTAAFDKQYLEGRYGADPYLQCIIGGDWE